ncbi:proline dehydrogenase [Microbispora triticiradicis]|uniref:proline dehydrogenase n=3 Tax=Microbispora TaxID=2005 RepID=A0ABY3LY79_9ACTN|nr:MULTISPECIES: proline dehydrogenase family protein [Microbispora]RGA01543.1 proline dehydrogenase [Microbispora triticiradicis]TLP55236.1 proline dehydrogenase [Microbispora fusca]TYB59612.1 proline dehydrogenase [Microbispora tritici]
MLGSLLLAGSRSPLARRAVSGLPLTRKVVDRFVAGESATDAVEAARRLTGSGLSVTIDHLGEEVRDSGAAVAAAKAYVSLLEALRPLGLGDRAEASVKLSAVGQALDPGLALENARQICAAARECGSTVTLDMEDHTTVDATLGALRTLREDFPETGVAIQAYLFRSEADCRDLAGSRVRLVKGAYAEPASVAHQRRTDVDRAYVRCLRVLMAGSGYPMVATHDDRLMAIAESLAVSAGRGPDDYEFQMLYGIRADRQAALAAAGSRVRVYVPYGDDWYGYFMRRLAERPANVAFFLRALRGG